MPVTLGAVSAGVGAAQAIGGLISGNSARKKLEQLKTPTYSPNKPISDYYQLALNRYNSGSYNSAFYENAQKTTQRNLATGISSLGDRRSALAGITGLVEGADRSMDQAGVQAEAQQRQALGALGTATQMKAGDDRMAFQYNQEAPYEKQMAILSGKASAGSQTENAGIQNIFGGLSGIGQYGMLKSLYGLGGKGGNQRGYYDYPGTGLADTGGPSILNQPSPASDYPTINPNSYSRF